MKKIFGLIMILTVIFTLCSCKQDYIDEQGASAQTQETEQNQEAEIKEEDGSTEQPEIKEEATETEKEKEKTEPETEQKEEQKEETEQSKEQPKEEESELTAGGGPKCKAKLEDNFHDNKVIVRLTLEQSKIKDQYTPEDFPFLNVEKVETIFNYYEDLENEAQISITLSTHSKQDVLDAIDILCEQSFVYSANVSPIGEVSPGASIY